MSTYAGKDNCTDTILDFIAGGVAGNPSGESDGNYNAEIGSPHATRDLSKMTLTQIYALQRQLRASGEPSTAIGRYQFIIATLQSIVAKKGLDPDTTLFGPEIEDQFAVSLLVGRGYTKWWDGLISDDDFLANLSQEWASLPDPHNGGLSHYDGDGVNSASCTLAAARAMLQRARAAQKAPVPEPVTPLPPAPQSGGSLLSAFARLVGNLLARA